MRSDVPRERLRFLSNPKMPPERRRRVRQDRKTQARPDGRAGARWGGPPRKAAPSCQRKSLAWPRAAAAAISVASEEEKRLRLRNRLTLEEDKPAVERCLEELVFGDVEDDEDALLRRLRGPRVQVQEDSDDSEVEKEAKDNFPPQKKPVWLDEEDEDEEMVDMMNNRFRKDMMKNANENQLSKDELQKRLKEEFQHAMGGVPAWAEANKWKTPSDDESEEDEDDLLQRTGNFISTSTSLPKGILKMKNCQHANAERPTTARISSVQFHPRAQVVMVAGLDNAVSLFQVDGKTNPKIQSIYLEKFPIFKACFSANGEEVLATSTHSKVLYVYDMLAGKLIPVHQVRGLKEKIVRSFEVSPDGSFLLINGVAGYFHLLSMKTKELIGSMKINGRIAASTFSSDSKKVYASSGDGEVYVWDVNSRKCLNRFVDEGSLYGLSIATSRNGQYVACGSNCGVVNIYNQDSCLQETNPKPIKAIMNLVTGVTSLTFNPTTEILAIASESMKDAVRLVHLPSFTVFSNFPVVKKKNISLIHTMDFSPRSGYFALGNEKGKALMYRLHHYSDF
ncbi:U3 small nucleolar RNA-associated protein 18 homolog isoform X2 [Cervus elaphus]|uniref:U3 small nucleolar RNA-associated protein 18 homolog isoform X2 n=1 Tax=Cervus canadensis TaxID=1574408 RepID=UPI0018BD9CBD|nr:U3 small nucleolar RNA-associated protein 18 homolog isoform X2 [Cervus canadensis]XP_043760054.1 U3 small nucleolar RNA-associated protein 18 homolog isoform X2 [Cervus elaphus]